MNEKNLNDVNAAPMHPGARPGDSMNAPTARGDEKAGAVPKKRVLDARSGETSDNDADTTLNSDARSAGNTSHGNVTDDK